MNYLNIIGLFLNFFGAGVIAFGLIKTKEQIENEASEFWGQNPHVKNSLYRDRKAAILGLSILAIGFVLQFISAIAETKA